MSIDLHAGVRAGFLCAALLAAPLSLATAAGEAAQAYAITEGPLDSALSQFARQAHITLTFTVDQVRGLRSAGLSGDYAVDAGLDALLAGTDLHAQIVEGGYVLVATAGEVMLPEVRVEATLGFDAGMSEGSGSYGIASANSANGLNLDPRHTPHSMSVVTRQQLQDQNLRNVADALSQVPGITVDHLDSERYAFTTRGGQGLNVMVDGKPQPDYWNNTSSELSMIGTGSTVTLDRVEVVRGATGLLNGTGSYGGSVNLVRKRPIAGAMTPQGGAGFGSWGRSFADVDVSADVSRDGKLRSRSVVSIETTGDYIDHYDSDERLYYAIVEAELSSDLLASIGIERWQADVDGSSFTHIPMFFSDGSPFKAPRRFNPAAPWTQNDETRTTIFADLRYTISEFWKLDASASWIDGELDIVRGGFASWAGLIDKESGEAQFFRSLVDERGERWAVDVRLEGSFAALGRRHDVVLGANYNRSDFDNTSHFFDTVPVNVYTWPDETAPYPLPSEASAYNLQAHVIEQTGLFGAVHFKPFEPLGVIVGTRYAIYDYAYTYDNLSNDDGSASKTKEDGRFVPYAALLFDLSKSLTAYVSYTDLFVPSSLRDRNNQVLPPEVGSNYEAGIKGEWFGGKLQPSLSFFRREVDNSPVEDPGYVLPDGNDAYRTVDGAVFEGWDVTVAGEPLKGWTLQGGFGSAFDNIAGYKDKFFNLTAAWEVTSKLAIGGNVTYRPDRKVGGDYSGFELDLGSLTLVDAFARYRIRNRLQVQLNVENLLDEQYIHSAGAYEGYLYGLPRSVMLGLRYTR